MKKITCAILMMASTMTASAQSGTNSPYSQYGFGVLSEQSGGFNRGMNGLSQGFREGNQVNFLNPASYSSVDSLTFLFDMGLSGQITNFKEGSTKKNAKNADFEYAVASFRARKHLGVSFGVVPFTNVGYSYSASGYVNGEKTMIYTNTYSGSGGLHQAYLGMGWEPIRHFSIGANISYLWGQYTRTISNSYSGVGSDASTESAWVNQLTKSYSASIRNYKLDVGVQYQQSFGKKSSLTIGAVYSPGHSLKSDAECAVTSNNASTSVQTATNYTVNDALELPDMVSAGFVWNNKNQLKVGADYTLQQWGKTSFPIYQVTNNVAEYVQSSDYFKDRHKITLGADYCKGSMLRRFLSRVHYRAGISYATPYVKINGKDGPKELSVSAGFGIPIINAYNNRSMLNISGQWVHQSGSNMITENTFRINVGITFNEDWFRKWKVQ